MKRLNYFEFKVLAERMHNYNANTINQHFYKDKPLATALAFVASKWNEYNPLVCIKRAYYFYNQQFDTQIVGEIIDPASDQLITFEFTTITIDNIKKNKATYTGKKQIEIRELDIIWFEELQHIFNK